MDKSGKFSQTNLLQSKLQSLGYSVVHWGFHNYAAPTGKLIMDWLTKKWDVDQTTIELIMAADKQASQSLFNKLEADGTDFLILDRYTLSQMVYGLATGSDEKWLSTLLDNVIKPNVDIVIDIPAEVSMTRKGKHNNGENDRYESDLKLLVEVRELYKKVSTDNSAPIKYIVDGQRSIDDIHESILEIVEERFLNRRMFGTCGRCHSSVLIVGDPRTVICENCESRLYV